MAGAWGEVLPTLCSELGRGSTLPMEVPGCGHGDPPPLFGSFQTLLSLSTAKGFPLTIFLIFIGGQLLHNAVLVSTVLHWVL